MNRAAEPRRMACLDFDGTLLGSDGRIAGVDRAALEEAGEAGVVRVLATGRSLFSLRRAVDDADLPVDHVIFSTGAGIRRMADGAILRSASLEAGEVDRAIRILKDLGTDFMVQDPIPDNHRFAYFSAGRPGPDFERRLALYRDHCRPLAEPHGPATQLLAILDGEDGAGRLLERLGDYSVIRATSPLDGGSTWIEIFPRGVSKGRAAAWLAGELGVPAERTLAVGNDTNDLDLLAWAGTARVVANSSAALRERFPVVADHDSGGVAEALAAWLSRPAPAPARATRGSPPPPSGRRPSP